MEQIQKDYDLIFPERYFLIIDNKNNRKFVTTNMKRANISKKNINLTFFNGKHLNTYWDVTDNANYTQITSKEFNSEEHFEGEEIEYSNEKILNASNKEIYQSEKSQKLTDDEINELKKTITNKDELIKAIKDNNSSMEKRTLLSQEKYIKKKTQKYKNLIWVTDPTLFNIVETFFIFDPKTINYLRMDSISTMLVNSNFLPGANTLIYEDTNNILTHAYAMRTHFDAKVYHVYSDKIANKNMNLFNFSNRQKSIIAYIEMKQLTDKKSFGYEMLNKKFNQFFSNLVICAKNDEIIPSIFVQLFDYLKYSGNVVVFAKDMEVLVTIDKYLTENKLGIDTKIIETVAREYQVLPLRTHPMMNHKGFSGYVLTSYKTVPSD